MQHDNEIDRGRHTSRSAGPSADRGTSGSPSRNPSRNTDPSAAPSANGGTDPAAGPSTIDIGAEAEARAVAFLERRGLEIVERNYTCKAGELDIVAIDGETMVFVEVRSRANDDHGGAIASVNRRKQRKVTRVAAVYLADRQPMNDEFRFDVVAVDGEHDEDITHYEDAWRGGLL